VGEKRFLDAPVVAAHADTTMTSVSASQCRSAKSRVRAGLAGLALMVVATIVPACGSYYDTSPPQGFGFARLGGPRSNCYVSAVLPDPVEAMDRLVEYYHSQLFGGGQARPVYATDKCRMMPPAGKRPNAYGWVGFNDPPIGYPTGIFLWVTPLHPQAPARMHLLIDTSAGGQNLL
jgi:hypothetical protein